ncbi:M23 family metallopeptidase, partial [Xanthomonas citri pv. citri]
STVITSQKTSIVRCEDLIFRIKNTRGKEISLLIKNEIYTSESYGECINLKGEHKGTTYYFFYAHLSSVDIVAKDNSGNPTKVKAGDTIGKSGKTGSSATALNTNQVHLHFELRTTNARTGGRIDPLSNISEFDT